MAEETRRQEPVSEGVTPARARVEGTGGQQRPPIVEVAGREVGDTSRTSPRMRFDLLQIAAWVSGIYLIVAGLVAIARAGFDDIGLFEPVVSVGDQQLTPLYAALWIIIGVVLLKAATGSVNEQGLRVGGVLFAVVGAVLLIEPNAFSEYLGGGEGDGTLLLAAGVLLVVASFVPPLSIARPGVPRS